jgi:hypothetical protein
MKHPTRLQPSGHAWQLKVGERNFSPGNLLLPTGAGAPAVGETICLRKIETAYYPLQSRRSYGPRSRPRE